MKTLYTIRASYGKGRGGSTSSTHDLNSAVRYAMSVLADKSTGIVSVEIVTPGTRTVCKFTGCK